MRRSGYPDGVSETQGERRQRHRRVRVPGAEGADPTPQGRVGQDASPRASGDTDAAWGDRPDSNDARLREDVPPHWGKR